MNTNDLPNPRNYEEFLIYQFLTEIHFYTRVFIERVVPSFANLREEADEVEQEEYHRLLDSGSRYSEEEDNSAIAEAAYFKGVDFYLAVDPIRQGVFNLMVAGLYHLFEQQSAKFSRPTSKFAIQLPTTFPVNDLKGTLIRAAIDIAAFQSWPLLDQLRLLANTVKHGDGRSADELRTLNPSLFRTKFDDMADTLGPPHAQLRPLVGEGMELDETHFSTYAAALVAFWERLRSAL